MKREYTTQNSHLMSLGKKRGVGELRERRWYYTAEELAELQAELDATRVNRSKAQKQTRRASLEAYRKEILTDAIGAPTDFEIRGDTNSAPSFNVKTLN